MFNVLNISFANILYSFLAIDFTIELALSILNITKLSSLTTVYTGQKSVCKTSYTYIGFSLTIKHAFWNVMGFMLSKNSFYHTNISQRY